MDYDIPTLLKRASRALLACGDTAAGNLFLDMAASHDKEQDEEWLLACSACAGKGILIDHTATGVELEQCLSCNAQVAVDYSGVEPVVSHVTIGSKEAN